ncbi:MAG TPA: VCBS repeat-containing protein [Planctomycetota bacterium]
MQTAPLRHQRWCLLALSSILTGTAAAQQADALLHAPLVVLPIDSPPFQKLGDVDGDGDPDAIGTRIHENRSNTEIVVWRNDQGSFTVGWQASFPLGGISSPSPRSFAVATADWNSDGLTDFVVAGGNGAVRYLAQPGFTFQAVPYQLPPFTFANSHAVAPGDFDGDSLLDLALVFMHSGTQNGELHVLLAAGGTVTTPITATVQAPLRLHALELNGVPGHELLVSDRSSPTAVAYELSGASLQLAQTLQSALTFVGTAPWKWMGGDLDGDNDVDIVVFRPEPGSNGLPRYQIFRRTGPATLTPEAMATGGPSEYLCDIDGDGDLDGICCGGGGPSYQWPQLDFASMFQIATNRGGGDFARSWSFPGAGSESMAGGADIDGDGDIDFVAGRCVLYGAGPWLENPMPPAGGANATVVKRPWDVHDLDRDGDPDFGPTLLNTGDGTFTAAPADPAPPAGHLFAGGIRVDVDGDGAEDRVMRLQTFNPPNPSQFVGMVWLQNNGGGHMRYAGPVAAPGLMIGAQFAVTADDYLAADCDGDGDGDIVYNDNPSATSQIFWNQAGTFVPGPIFGFLVGGRVDRVADFDGDNLPDLLMTGNLNGLHVRRGTGVPAAPFQITWTGPALPFEPGAVTVADVDNDGKLDFVRPDGNGDAVLFVNNSPLGGGPTFQPNTLLGARIVLASTSGGAQVRSTIAAADFDGDGLTDLALGRIPGEPNVGLVLRRIGWSTPPSLADYQVVRQVFVDGYLADSDLDGDPDLLGVYSTRNRRFEGVAAGKRVQRHAGVAGEAGAVPVLGATGPFRSGFVEVLRLTGVPGPTIAILGLSLGEVQLPNVPLPGLTLRLDPSTLLIAGWPINGNGQGRAAAMTTLPIYLQPGQLGTVYYLQAFVFDPAAPSAFSHSNLMVKQVGL